MYISFLFSFLFENIRNFFAIFFYPSGRGGANIWSKLYVNFTNNKRAEQGLTKFDFNIFLVAESFFPTLNKTLIQTHIRPNFMLGFTFQLKYFIRAGVTVNSLLHKLAVVLMIFFLSDQNNKTITG